MDRRSGLNSEGGLLRRRLLDHALVKPALSRQAGSTAGERCQADDGDEDPQHAAAN